MSVRRSGLSALRLYAINSFGYSKNLRSYLRPSLLLACVVDLKLATVFIPLHLPARTALSRDSFCSFTRSAGWLALAGTVMPPVERRSGARVAAPRKWPNGERGWRCARAKRF